MTRRLLICLLYAAFSGIGWWGFLGLCGAPEMWCEFAGIAGAVAGLTVGALFHAGQR